MGNRDIVVIGTSAGGVEALLSLARGFEPDFPAAVVVTIHLPMQPRSVLDQILTRAGSLPARFAADGEAMRKGSIYIAPPGYHLIVDDETLSLGTGPRENNARPAIDAMMRSAAVCCGYRAVGVLLTGTLGDGSAGLVALGRCGGITVVQDPADAAFPEMPLTALNQARPDHIVRLADIPRLLTRLAHEPAAERVMSPDKLRYEVDIARDGHSRMTEMDRFGRRSVLSCPDCGGVMWVVDDGDVMRFRCHVGHAYTAELMNLTVDESLRRALASARRAFDERIALLNKMAVQSDNGGSRLAENWRERARDYEREARIIDDAIDRLNRLAAEPEPEPV
jgi:two-component system chemotaxis response regulator CheB